jgi:3-hydroxyacyl-CoA dehydrogenase/enoyl-CoA hydratase/3-hydroxybutyryl-CoA epimerase
MDRESVVTTRLINGAGNPSTLIVNFESNSLNNQAFKELHEVIDRVEQLQNSDPSNKIDGVIFTTTKPKIFLAGADLFFLRDNIDMTMILSTVIDVGQEMFSRIENLKVPTVAAIHGACLGGGLELALACDYRICSNDKATKLGLPEVTLGILPAWGGCTRLPELVGVPNALQAILTGKQYAPKPAKRLGLVDDVVHRENLISTSIDIITGKKKFKRKFFKTFAPDWLAARVAKKNVLKKTKGNYPAPLRAIQVIRQSGTITKRDSLANEKQAFLDLCKTKEMRNLLNLFFMQEKSKKLLADGDKYARVNDVVVVGAGTMGAGIAQWVSSRGVNVLLKDVSDDLVNKGLQTIGDLYVRGVLGYKMDRPTARDSLARISTTTTDVPLKDKDILIEAIVEDLDIKQKVLSQLEEDLPADTIIATNTSALSIDEMASCLKHPERFVGIHFFNPVHKMKLVEVVRGSKTNDVTVKRAVEFVQQIGKLPVVVKDSPGFVVNRILVPYLVEASQMLLEGIYYEDIDRAMVEFGMPMGPFRLMDEIGLDVCYHVARDLINRLEMTRECSLEEIEWRVESNRLGKKTGQGFYKYKKGRSVKTKVKLKSADVTRLISSMTEEAQKVLDEGVIDDPRMLDFAMVMGTGWAPFRGGPIEYKNQA